MADTAGLVFRAARADSAEALRLLADYEAELVSLGVVLNQGSPGGVTADRLVPPYGGFVVAWRGEEAVACGGVRLLGPEVCEIKRMYVVPSARGAGLARRLLGHLESVGRDLGATTARLDTGRDMAPAVALYRSSGYAEIDDYNGNPEAGWWFEKAL
jgi:GNAT superfamily N-acetyltransferase